jgi:hypothetical protein
MGDLDNTLEVADATEGIAMDAFNEAAEEAVNVPSKFTAEDISKARAQEKAKLYPQIDKMTEELAILRKREEERAAIEAERESQRKERAAQRDAERKAKEEDEMSFKELLKNKEEEWASKLEAERLEREKAFALLEREREFQELSTYRQQRVEQERDNIVPELIDLVSGNTKDEIENSIADLKARTNKLLESVAQVAQQSRKEMVGTRITVPASGPLDNDSDSRTYSPNDISNMSMADYAKNRSKLLGNSKNSGQGLFG